MKKMLNVVRKTYGRVEMDQHRCAIEPSRSAYSSQESRSAASTNDPEYGKQRVPMDEDKTTRQLGYQAALRTESCGSRAEILMRDWTRCHIPSQIATTSNN